MAVINQREREELLGGMRSLPLRAAPALLTTVLLFLSGDMVGLWALSWIAFVPLCFACRGAGGPGALLLATGSLLSAAVLQSFWLLDVDGVSPPLIWLAAGVLPALPFMAIELPICKSVFWPLRPLLVTALAIGCWFLLPREAQFLVPVGGLIDSELVRFAYPQLGLATMAGLFVGIAWLSAEMFHNPRQRGRSGWHGWAVAALLVLALAADWVGSAVKPQPVGVKDVTRVHVLPGGELTSLVAEDGVAFVVWTVTVDTPAELETRVAQSGEFAELHDSFVLLMAHSSEGPRAFFFVRRGKPRVGHTWLRSDALMIESNDASVIVDGVGRLRIYPVLTSEEHWASMWDLELYLSDDEPAHPAQLRYWLREQRREALVRGSRQVCVWSGGACAVDGIGRMIARSDGEPVTALLPASEERGQPLGRPRLTIMERILALASPVIIAMLVLLTPVRWAKIRYRARKQATTSVAIEEIVDGETTLSKEETKAFTRRFEKPD